ncbi:MAG: type II secretion system F family protein [Nocardioidaceae bacterium]
MSPTVDRALAPDAVAVACAMAAVALLVRGPRRFRSGGGGVLRTGAGVVVAAALVVFVTGRGALAPVLVVAAGAAGALRLWRRRVSRAGAAAVSGRVLECCRLLAAELGAGRPPGDALALAAEEWPALAPVVEAFALGSDVPTSLRRLAAEDGARDLRVLAAAWEVAHRSGRGLAAAVSLVADELQAQQLTRRVVEAELASARATARLVAALPGFALLMGSGIGGDPWRFLLGTPAGIACLAGGLGLMLAGIAWIEAIAAGVADG